MQANTPKKSYQNSSLRRQNKIKAEDVRYLEMVEMGLDDQ